MPRAGKARGWCFTINNPGSAQEPQAWEEDGKGIKFCIWSLEKGETDGTPHLQGYVLFDNPTTLGQVKLLHARAHWEPRKGTHEQARDYCTKSNTHVEGPFQFGTEPRPGKRTDLDSLKEAIDAGSTESDLWEINFSAMVKFNRGIREYKRIKTGNRTWKTEVTVLWGPTGTGKTMSAQESLPRAFWKRPDSGANSWWDGYDGHEDVIIDEFYGWIRWDLLLRLLDRYPLLVDTKGGAVSFVARRIIITSNAHPSDWFHYDGKKQYATLHRRLDRIGHVHTLGEEPVWEKNSPNPVIGRAPNYCINSMENVIVIE